MESVRLFLQVEVDRYLPQCLTRVQAQHNDGASSQIECSNCWAFKMLDLCELFFGVSPMLDLSVVGVHHDILLSEEDGS